MLKLLQVVLPAVEKAIALKIADPERLYLMGQSFGGYAVYGLILNPIHISYEKLAVFEPMIVG